MKVLITPRSFGQTDPSVFETLRQAGVTIVRNESGGILDKQAMKEMLGDCDGVILGVDPLDADVLEAAPKLRAISKYGVGVDNIDLSAAEKRGVIVSRTVGANSAAVADYALALMLAVARRVTPIDAACRKGDWKKQTTVDVANKTLGLLGFGAIGRLVARRAKGFDMQVFAYDPFWDDVYAKSEGILQRTPEEIYRQADIISLHLPLTGETKGMIGVKELSWMKPEAILVNTSRGGLIDEDALLTALKERKIYGAGIDAFEQEPPENRDWFQLDNVVLGSHCAASTAGAILNMGRMATENLLRDLGLN